MNIHQEFVLCAAIHLDDGKEYVHQPVNIQTGIVIVGRRHHNCYTTIADTDEKGYWKKFDKGRACQGFLTSLNRYLSREEAFVIAKAQGQIRHKMHDDKEVEMLTSEDLY